jgi:hypothetical protein
VHSLGSAQSIDLKRFILFLVSPWNFAPDRCVENSPDPDPKSAGNESEIVDKMPSGFNMTVPADFNGKRDG